MDFSINEKLPVYEIKAENFAAQSSNKIHNSEMAQTYGFSEGLVPGIAIYAYMAHPIAMTLGIDWLKNGIDPARLSAKGYGESRPVADNGRPDGRALNRRVEISVVKK